MPEIQARCPQCEKGVRVSVSETQDVASLKCRNCGKGFKVRVPRVAATGRPDDPLDLLSSPPANPSQPASLPSGGQRLPAYAGKSGTHHYGGGYSNAPKSKSAGVARWLVGCAVAGLALLTLGAGLWWMSGAGNSPGGGAAIGWTTAGVDAAGAGRQPRVNWPKLPQPENSKVLASELLDLILETDRIAAALTDAELQTIGAERLAAARAKFEALRYRVWQATPIDLTMMQLAESGRTQSAQIERLRSELPATPPKNYIWRMQDTNDPQDHWGRECFAISRVKSDVDAALNSLSRLPDPLKDTSNAYDWSAEDRRVLSAYWLQGSLERDVISELLACLREGQTIDRLTERCTAVLERYYQPALELAAVPSTQGRILIKEPQGTPYAKHAFMVRRVMQTLREQMAEDEVIEWILGMTVRFSDGIEDLQFGRDAVVKTVVAIPMKEHYQELVAALAREEQAKLVAAEQARQEEARAAAAAAAKEAEAQRQQQAAAERSREASAANPTDLASGERPNDGGGLNSGGSPGRFGQGRPRRAGPAGAPPGFATPPEAGPPPGVGQPRDNGSFSEGRPNRPGAGAAPGRPPSMGPTVTIRITGPANMNVNAFLETMKGALNTGNYRFSQSGREATLVLGYAGDLQAAVDAIDFGKVQSADPTKREIRVVVP